MEEFDRITITNGYFGRTILLVKIEDLYKAIWACDRNTPLEYMEEIPGVKDHSIRPWESDRGARRVIRERVFGYIRRCRYQIVRE